MPGDVIEFGIVRKGFKEYRPTGLLDFNKVTLEGLRDLAKKTQRDSPQSLASTSSNDPQHIPKDLQSKTQWMGVSLKKRESFDEFTKCNVIQRPGQRICLTKEENKCSKDSAGWG